MPALYQTRDPVASVRQAYEKFTHVVVNRSYHINKPVFFRSGGLVDLPIFIYQPWKEGADSQLAKWREEGGVLMDATNDGKLIGRRDVTVIVEAPLGMARLNNIRDLTDEYVVVRHPGSWKTHEAVTELKAPMAARLRAVREAVKATARGPHTPIVAGVSRHPDSPYVCSDDEVAAILSLPLKEVETLRRSLRPQEVWCVTPRLAPEAPAHLAVWDLVLTLPDMGGGERMFTGLDGNFKMYRRALKDMARLGHIGLRRYRVYPVEEPNYKKITASHKKALADLKAVQALLESAPFRLP